MIEWNSSYSAFYILFAALRSTKCVNDWEAQQHGPTTSSQHSTNKAKWSENGGECALCIAEEEKAPFSPFRASLESSARAVGPPNKPPVFFSVYKVLDRFLQLFSRLRNLLPLAYSLCSTPLLLPSYSSLLYLFVPYLRVLLTPLILGLHRLRHMW